MKNCRTTRMRPYATPTETPSSVQIATSHGHAATSRCLTHGMMTAAERSATTSPTNAVAIHPLIARSARSTASSINGRPSETANTPARAVMGGVLRAAKNSGLLATTSKIG